MTYTPVIHLNTMHSSGNYGKVEVACNGTDAELRTCNVRVSVSVLGVYTAPTKLVYTSSLVHLYCAKDVCVLPSRVSIMCPSGTLDVC